MGIAARRITISTCGIVPGIERLAKLDLQVNLSLSLHAVTDRQRDRLMPVNRKYPLEEVVRASEAYCESCGRMMTLEYVLIRGVNDSPADAEGLAAVARRLRAKVNLIAFSPVPGLAFAPPEESALREFVGRLEERRVHVTVRRSKGSDIAAACGQLAGRKRGEARGNGKAGRQVEAPPEGRRRDERKSGGMKVAAADGRRKKAG